MAVVTSHRLMALAAITLLGLYGCDDDASLRRICPVTCYTGPEDTRNVGACHEGTPVCDDDGNVLYCDGQALPSGWEICDGLDNDCDGSTDEGLLLQPYHHENRCRQCGACSDTKEWCVNGEWVCDYATPPAEDDATCDGRDDDCDCDVDEDHPANQGFVFCYSGPDGTALNGICTPGYERCENGQVTCEGEVTPAPQDDCSGRDIDCNGLPNDSTTLYEYVAMVIVVDRSASMGDVVTAVENVVCDYATGSQFSTTQYRFALINVAQPEGGFTLTQNMTDAQGLCDAIRSSPNSGGIEPTLTAAETVVNPENPLMIDWPEDAKRIMIGFTDEPAQVVSIGSGLGFPNSAWTRNEAVVNTLAMCVESQTDIYWFIEDNEYFMETALGCGGRTFQLTDYEPWMLESLNTILGAVCLEGR